jgi:C-terminal processing protease CtpA/Prc
MLAALVALLLAPPGPPEIYRKDQSFAYDALERECGRLLEAKGISLAKVKKELAKEAAAVRTPEDHWVYLARLVARLHDGHAGVLTTEKTKELKWPLPLLEKGPGLCWCAASGKVWVKGAWGTAAGAGVEVGMEVVKVEGQTAAKWLDLRAQELSDLYCFSTKQGALYFACHGGLGGPAGSTLELELRHPVTKKTKKATLTRGEGGLAAAGPAVFPPGLQAIGRNSYGKLASGYGYIHLRHVPETLPEDLDRMLEALADPPGLVLDCRANGGGACDHDAVFGRFVPKGATLNFEKEYGSAGPRPYKGPIVVIVDAGVVSAGETVSGMLKEDGRAYMIGPEATAGMSSQKTTIELPSGLFKLYVSVGSHKSRFNGGKGIEGIGVPPHEIVPYDPTDLAGGIDTQIKRAEELLSKGFPKNTVPYHPERYK